MAVDLDRKTGCMMSDGRTAASNVEPADAAPVIAPKTAPRVMPGMMPKMMDATTPVIYSTVAHS